MDLRVLRYFLAVAEEGGITKAAARLYLSQPALSAQLSSLEKELGHVLFERGPRGITLTEKGRALKRRAEDLVAFAGRIEEEIKAAKQDEISGTVSIGAGETPAFGLVARAASALKLEHPHLNFSVSSGNGEDVISRLQDGSFDLAVLVGPGRYHGFDYLALPHVHRWGVVARVGSSLAGKKSISAGDLEGEPLLCSRQSMLKEFISGWLGKSFDGLNVVATYNLFYNASFLVDAGIGCAICIDGVIPAELSGRVVFRPFEPSLASDVYLAWRRNAELSPAAKALLGAIRSRCAGSGGR